MDECIISSDHTRDIPKRSFWSLHARKKLADAAEASPHCVDDHAAFAPRRSNDTTSSWRSHKSMKSTSSRGDRKERKKSRLSIWKSWFLALIKSKSKSSMERSASHCRRGSGSQVMLEPNLFGLSCVPSLNSCAPYGGTEEIARVWQDAKLNHLGMAVVLPEDVVGADLSVNIELKALPPGRTQSLAQYSQGLHFLEMRETGPVYTGYIIIPSNVTLLQVAQMPFYFLNGTSYWQERKVETIVQPLENIIPENYDKTLIVEEIHLRIHFETTASYKFNRSNLIYEFLTDPIPIVVEEYSTLPAIPHSEISFRLEESMLSLKTEGLIEQITDETDTYYDESSKCIVKEILNEVVSKLSLKSSSDFIKDFHKELEEQKVLLLETTSSILPDKESLLSKISETEQEDASSTSRTSSKSLEAQNSSESTVPASNITSESSFCLAVPSNTPEALICTVKYAVNEIKKFSIDKAVKKDVKADIDMTLKLLETAKNKLLSYLNQDTDVSSSGQESNRDSSVKIKVVPFKDLDDGEFFHEMPRMQSEKERKEVEEEPKAELKVEDKEKDDAKEEVFVAVDTLDEVSVCETKTKTNPVHDLEMMLLEEIKKQPCFPANMGRDEFNLEYLAYGNVFLDNDVIEDMTDSYLNDDQLDLLAEYQVFSLNTDVFDQRYMPADAEEFNDDERKLLRERARVVPATIDDDIHIMIQELMEHSGAIRECARTKEQGDARRLEVVEDVKYVLNGLIQRVEEHVALGGHEAVRVNAPAPAPRDPQVYHVNQVYFCLIDDHVDVFPTAGRAGGGNPLAWLTGRMRTHGAAQTRWSTVSVRRTRPNGRPNSGQHTDGTCGELLDKLEKGSAYLYELYNEIYSRPLRVLQFRQKLGSDSFSMSEAKHANLPLVRKSKKIITFENRAGTSSKETVEESLKKVINPSRERVVLKNKMREEGLGAYRGSDLLRWPMCNYEWVNSFIRPSRLTALIKIRGNIGHFSNLKVYNNNRDATSKVNISSPLRLNRNLLIKLLAVRNENKLPLELLNSPMDDDTVSVEILSDNIKKNVAFTDSDDGIPKSKQAEKKYSKSTGRPQCTNSDLARPGTSTADDNDMILLHAENIRPVDSQAEFITLASENSGEKIVLPIADVPRRFATSSMEQTYMKNIAVLRDKLDNISTTTLYSSSSSEGSLLQSIAIHPVPERMVTSSNMCNVLPNSPVPSILTNNNLSKNNLLLYASSESEVASRSSHSRATTADYDADLDAYPITIPELRPAYISHPELNHPDEVARIEENLLKNERLNPLIKSLSGPNTALSKDYSHTESLSTETSISLKTSDLDAID